MPYIADSSRPDLTPTSPRSADTVGELDFQITILLLRYIDKDPSFQRIADCIAAAKHAGDEFKRRLADPYEDRKIRENGDVYYDAHGKLRSWA